MKTKHIVLFLLISVFFVLTISNTNAQQEKYYAAFSYQFTNYITWPSAPAVFIMGVGGNSTVTPHLQQLAKDKKVGTSAIIVMEWKSPEDIAQCNLLFVPEEQKGNISAIAAKVGSKPVLVVTESQGLTKSGADISFLKKDGRIQFELNKTQIQKKGLVVSPDLERLAAKVY
jgi:hypothetical protein